MTMMADPLDGIKNVFNFMKKKQKQKNGDKQQQQSQQTEEEEEDEEKKKGNIETAGMMTTTTSTNNKNKNTTTTSTNSIQLPAQQPPQTQPLVGIPPPTTTTTSRDSCGFNHSYYEYPTLVEEAQEMLQISMLIYSMTDLRTLAKRSIITCNNSNSNSNNNSNNKNQSKSTNSSTNTGEEHNKVPQSQQQQLKSQTPSLKNAHRILELPLDLTTCLELLEENYELLQQQFGNEEHINTITSIQSIHARYNSNPETLPSLVKTQSTNMDDMENKTNKNQQNNASIVKQWFQPLLFVVASSAGEESVEILPQASTTTTSASTTTTSTTTTKATVPSLPTLQHAIKVPQLTAYGDENADSDMVYAVGIDPIRKRITVAFRGSVTPTDFIKDASIVMNHQPNPIAKNMMNMMMMKKNQKETVSTSTSSSKQQQQKEAYQTIGIHHGFYEYLLKKKKDNHQNKLQEILEHVNDLFQQVPYRQTTYKLYVTGHSLGGALATLFSFYVAAMIISADGREEGDGNGNEEHPHNNHNRNNYNQGVSQLVIPAPISCISVASPRVGDRNFQVAFQWLEQRKLLRHLRIANHRDPVTLLPSATGKKIWATLSPISYLAFKIMDKEFEEKETFRHVGIKLLLFANHNQSNNNQNNNNQNNNDKNDTTCPPPPLCQFYYAGQYLDVFNNNNNNSNNDSVVKLEDSNNKNCSVTTTQSTTVTKNSNNNSNNNLNIPKSNIPDVMFHLGKAYTDNIAAAVVAQPELTNIYLNQIYQKLLWQHQHPPPEQ